MPPNASALDILDREFLQIRTRLIDIAAAFDRIDRGHHVEAVDIDHSGSTRVVVRAGRVDYHHHDTDYQTDGGETQAYGDH